jgi:hypothetical protein
VTEKGKILGKPEDLEIANLVDIYNAGHYFTAPSRAWEDDEHMTPSDTTIDYKVHSFLYLHSNFGYNSLGSTCTCRYLNIGTNVFQSASPSKLNFRFVGNPIVLHWEGHNLSIRSAIEVNEHLMEKLI